MAKLGRLVAKLRRWVTKLGSWVTKLVARLLVTSASLRSNPDIFQKYIMGDLSKRSGQHILACQKNVHKNRKISENFSDAFRYFLISVSRLNLRNLEKRM